jgi:hypothetical protein
MWLLFFSPSFSSVTTVTASATFLSRKSFSVAKGDYVILVFPDPDGFVIASKPNPTSFNVAQACTDPCSTTCSWFHRDQEGILSIGSFPGVVEYYATSSGTFQLTYGYVYPTDAYFYSERCTEIWVNLGPTAVSSAFILDAHSVSCFFESDIQGYITSTPVTRYLSLYTNSGFSRFLASGNISNSWTITGVLLDNTEQSDPLGFELYFTSRYDRYALGWYYRCTDPRSWPDPIIYSGQIEYGCFTGRNSTPKTCGSSETTGIIIGAVVGAVAVIAGIVGFVFWMRRKKLEQLPTEKLLPVGEGGSWGERNTSGTGSGRAYGGASPYSVAAGAEALQLAVAPPPFLPHVAPQPYPMEFDAP